MTAYEDFLNIPSIAQHVFWTIRYAATPVPIDDLYTDLDHICEHTHHKKSHSTPLSN